MLAAFLSELLYLGVSDQLAGGLQNTEQVFDNVSYTKRWYANVFAGIPDYSGINSVNVGAFKNPWTGMCDELVVGYGNSSKYNNSDRNAANIGIPSLCIRYIIVYKEMVCQCFCRYSANLLQVDRKLPNSRKN